MPQVGTGARRMTSLIQARMYGRFWMSSNLGERDSPTTRVSSSFARCCARGFAASWRIRLCSVTEVVSEPASTRPGQGNIRVKFLGRAVAWATDRLQSKLHPPHKVLEIDNRSPSILSQNTVVLHPAPPI